MATDQRAQAAAFRVAAEAHPSAPEGLELFRWMWVPAAWPRFVFPAARRSEGFATAGALPPPFATFPEPVVIERRIWIIPKASAELPEFIIQPSIGWDAEERVAVLFYARGGELPPRTDASPISDVALHAVADEGSRLRFREMVEDLKRMLDEEAP